MQKNPRNLRPHTAFYRKIHRHFGPSQGLPPRCSGMGFLPDRKNTEFFVLLLSVILLLGSSCSDSPDGEKTKRDGCITSIRVYPRPEEYPAPGAVTVYFTIKDKTLEHQLPNLDKKISIVNKTLNNLGVHRLLILDYSKETHQFNVKQPDAGLSFLTKASADSLTHELMLDPNLELHIKLHDRELVIVRCDLDLPPPPQ